MVSPISGSSSNIKELVISGAFLCSEAVAAILDAPKALCKFEFRYSHKCFVPLNSEDDPKAVWARHSYSLIGEALKKHKTSLVYLYLWDKIDLELLQAYINNSGGDPQKITDLTYEGLKTFHEEHYHPSNSKICKTFQNIIREHNIST